MIVARVRGWELPSGLVQICLLEELKSTYDEETITKDLSCGVRAGSNLEPEQCGQGGYTRHELGQTQCG